MYRQTLCEIMFGVLVIKMLLFITSLQLRGFLFLQLHITFLLSNDNEKIKNNNNNFAQFFLQLFFKQKTFLFHNNEL